MTNFNRPFPVKKAIELLCKYRNYTFIGSKVVTWHYDWRTTYKQGDSGYASERHYEFKTKDGISKKYSTVSLRNTAQSILYKLNSQQALS